MKHGEEMTIAGIRFQFFTEGSSDFSDTHDGLDARPEGGAE